MPDGQVWIWPFASEPVDTPVTANWFYGGVTVPTDWIYLTNLAFTTPYVEPGDVPW